MTRSTSGSIFRIGLGLTVKICLGFAPANKSLQNLAVILNSLRKLSNRANKVTGLVLLGQCGRADRAAAHADQHIQIRPGTDAALALAMMHVIVRDNLHDKEFIEAHTLGFDQLAERVKEYPPERAATITGIDADVIEKLAHAYATTRPAAIRFLVGMERYSNGHVAVRAVSCLPGLIGGWRERGGGLSHFMLNIFFQSV
ncbi:MAG: putative molibdopterin-dependent oxidoreductase YjgC [Gammaproteobacteria bacterium]